jgi:ATP adenylyltransferase
LLAKVVAATSGPAAAQVKRAAGCSVAGRESPWVTSLTRTWRAAIELAYTLKLADFLQRRGLATWDYRLIQSDPVPADVRYQVLTASKGRCALCGATSDERRIEVDHIIPRSRGGSNDITSLQALCDVCNRGKSNTDDTDFRILPTADDA